MYWNIVFFEWPQRRLLLFYLKDVKVIRCGALSIKCNRIVNYFGKNLDSTCKHECMLHQWITVLFFPWNCGLWISSSCQLPCNISWIVLTSSCAGGLHDCNVGKLNNDDMCNTLPSPLASLLSDGKSAIAMRFGSRGPSCSSRIRCRNALTEKAWENAVHWGQTM